VPPPFQLHTVPNLSRQLPSVCRGSHRMTECFGLEGTFKGHLAQPPCSEQGHLLDQVAQSAVQPGLECFQGWGIQHLSGQPVLVFHHPHCTHPRGLVPSRCPCPFAESRWAV